MTEQYYTVGQIAKMLSMHPKTVQRYIREGKLRATKIGKGWRITGHDLSVFMEAVRPDAQRGRTNAAEQTTVSAVADIPVRSAQDAIYITNTLTGALNGKPPEYGQTSLHTQHIPQQGLMRVSLWGGIRFMQVMMEAIAMLTENMTEQE